MAVQSRKLLIAMDGSKHADYAFDWFLKYFYKDKDDVTIVYCAEHGRLVTAPIPSSDPTTVAKLAKEEEGEIATLVSNLQRKLGEAKIRGSVQRVSGAKPGEAIVKAAEEFNVDIIITGTRGHGTIRRTLMGSVSEYIVHHAKVPVLVVRHE